jgi:AraC family transcriptional regulator
VKSEAVTLYHSRMQRVLDYIDAHLEDDLSLDVLCGVAAFSKFHFHRQFSELLGVSAGEYVQLVRLKRATYRLAFRNDSPVLQIALDSGYEAPEAFARAFKQKSGQTPSEFRKKPDWNPWLSAYAPVSAARSKLMKSDFNDDDVRFVHFPDTPVAVLEHRGDPALIVQTVGRCIAWRKQHGLSPKVSATFNILRSPPETLPEDFQMDLCTATDRAIAPNEFGVAAGFIPGGRCAVLRHAGSDEALMRAGHFLYADWLPRSGEELRDFPPFLQRVLFFPDVQENEAVTDIFLPLK